MTYDAVPRRAAIDHHAAAVDFPALVVAEPAGYLGVGAAQGETAGLLVVEQGRGPVGHAMAGRAVDQVIAVTELAGMNVLVTPLTPLRGGLEADFAQAGVRSGGPVAVLAIENRMRTLQLKAGDLVIEGFQLMPGTQHVTRLTAVLPRPHAGF